MHLAEMTVVEPGPDWTLRVEDGYYQRAKFGSLGVDCALKSREEQASGCALEINTRLSMKGWSAGKRMDAGNQTSKLPLWSHVSTRCWNASEQEKQLRATYNVNLMLGASSKYHQTIA